MLLRSIPPMAARESPLPGWECCLRCSQLQLIIQNCLITSELLHPKPLVCQLSPVETCSNIHIVQASFHCLRLSNFLIRPSLESLQALLILGFVLANDMKAEASWALIGLTCRLAQALGLHRGPHENARVPQPTASDLPRRKLWWVVLFYVLESANTFQGGPLCGKIAYSRFHLTAHPLP